MMVIRHKFTIFRPCLQITYKRINFALQNLTPGVGSRNNTMKSIFTKRHFWKRLAVIAISLSAAASSVVASVNDLPVKVVNGKRYHYYEVKQKETIFSIERKLGIPRDVIYANNPSTRDGLKAFSTLLFPADEAPEATTAVSAKAPTHKVTKGETIYGISKNYGITIQQIYDWNPALRNSTLKAGETIIVGQPSDTAPSAPQPSPERQAPVAADKGVSEPQPGPDPLAATRDYVVKKNETFYSIARANGMTIAQLEELNPGAGALKEGDIVKLPSVSDTQTISILDDEPVAAELQRDNTGSVAAPPSVAADEVTAIETFVVEPKPSEINIALALPLMLNQKPQSKQAQLFVEYLKGFLVAVDSMRNNGTPIKVSVFDTCSSLDTLTNILANDDFRSAQLVVAPDNEAHLMRLASYGRSNGVYVFNPFVVKDDSYTTNPYMMQANIPQQQMYEKAIDGVITRYADRRPVFVTRADGKDDKKEAFIKAMKERFSKAGMEYSIINFNNKLSRSDLNQLPTDRPLLIIPTSGLQAEANKIFPALADFKDAGNDVIVFGYPEWTTFRGETLTNMHALNTVVYSRFFTTADDTDSRGLDEKFNYWYGTPMANVLPRQGMLGFDSGMYLINALKQNGGDFSQPVVSDEGIQNGYHFIVPEGASGMINDALYFIYFRDNERIERTRL